MAVVLPHGVLFRGAAEGIIRRYLIEEKNYLEAVIGFASEHFLWDKYSNMYLSI